MIERSQIFRGEVTHKRLTSTEHAFTYPVTFFAFDLAEIPHIASEVPVFGHNEARPVSLRDRDYLRGRPEPIESQLDEFLPPRAAGERTLLVSSPRYFGYAFNPVNFHLRMVGQKLSSAVAEVNNTFGDRHVYPLKNLQTGSSPQTWHERLPKEFHVSPFNNMAGEYEFTFRVEKDSLFLGVDLHRDGACVMKTWIQGEGRPLTEANLIRYFLLHPFDTALNSMPRIVWQAALLHYRKKLRVFKRPSPSSKDTLIDRDRAGPGATAV